MYFKLSKITASCVMVNFVIECTSRFMVHERQVVSSYLSGGWLYTIYN